MVSLHIRQLIKMKLTGALEYYAVEFARNYANWCRNITEVVIRMQWPRWILPVKN